MNSPINTTLGLGTSIVASILFTISVCPISPITWQGHHNRLSSFVSVGQEFLRAFPDVKVNVISLIAENDYVVELNTVTATHQGKYFNIPATNRTVNWTEAHIYQLQNERIVENIPSVNFEHIINQIS